jgi:peptidoglycan/LPS O-acetylase OafA/YrhL
LIIQAANFYVLYCLVRAFHRCNIKKNSHKAVRFFERANPYFQFNMLLSHLLRRENNNIDLLRLIAALAVIYGHAYAITLQPPLGDLLNRLIEGEYSGSIAVKFFFFLSGIVVTNSLLRNPSLRSFAISRLLRLMPALLICLLLTCFVVAPLLSTLSASEYFSSPGVYQYLWHGLLFHPEWTLPGVFATHPNTAVNGSLWTLPIELTCYTTVFVIAALNFFRDRLVAFVVISALIAALILIYQGILPWQSPVRSETTLLKCYFFGGVWLCLLKDQFEIDVWKVGVLFAFVLVARNTSAWSTALVILIFIGALWTCSLPFVRDLRLPGDYSYGVYLYGFLVQQCMREIFPDMYLRTHQIVSMLIALILGALSWHLIEKPVMQRWKSSRWYQ